MNSPTTNTTSSRWRAPELGPKREIQLPQGYVHYYERGRPDASAVVFIHGWLTNANIWRKVITLLSDDYRCIAPDFPFGSHLQPMNEDADLTPNGCGQLILDFIREMALSGITLVGNDSGGAYSQIATSIDLGRISHLILTACETPYDKFPPPTFAGLVAAAKSPQNLQLVLEVLRNRDFRAQPQAYGKLAKFPLDPNVSDSFVLPLLTDFAISHDASKVFASASERYIQEAGNTLIENFTSPVFFLWPEEDNFFSLQNAQKYADALRHAEVQVIKDSYSFTAEDQPTALAECIRRSLTGSLGG